MAKMSENGKLKPIKKPTRRVDKKRRVEDDVQDDALPIPYSIRRSASGPGRKRKRGDDSPVPSRQSQAHDFFRIADDDSFTVVARPDRLGNRKQWSELLPYGNFLCPDGTKFQTGDVAYIQAADGQKPRSLSPGGNQYDDCWVAQILEIRSLDTTGAHVYLRVRWLYRPEDLPGGRQKYHADGEVVPSNHLDIIEAGSVEGKPAAPEQLDETDFTSVSGGYGELFWRQTYNVLRNQLSSLAPICICKQPAAPDYGPVRCVSPDCGKWMHPECVEADALQRFAAGNAAPATSASSPSKLKESTPDEPLASESLTGSMLNSALSLFGRRTPKRAPAVKLDGDTGSEPPESPSKKPTTTSTPKTSPSKVSPESTATKKAAAASATTTAAAAIKSALKNMTASLVEPDPGSASKPPLQVEIKSASGKGEPHLVPALCLFCEAELPFQEGHIILDPSVLATFLKQQADQEMKTLVDEDD